MPQSATATAPQAAAPESPKPTTDPKAKTKAPEAKVHTALQELIVQYDQHVQEAESYYVKIIEVIQRDKISRADVVQTLMKARGITFESAQSQYSRMKGIWQNEEVLKGLKDGSITLKMAREKTTKKQNSPASGKAGSTSSGDASKETKEARYERVRKAHVAAVKECGFDLRSALLSFEADLKGAGVK